jgi:hypothetical protein
MTAQLWAWRRPLLKKRHDCLRRQLASGFEFPILLAVKQSASFTEHGNGRHPALQWNLILLGHVLVSGTFFADVNMRDYKILLYQGPDSFLVEAKVEHVAIGAPVRPKNQQHALVLCRRLLDGTGNLLAGVSFWLVDLLIQVNLYLRERAQSKRNCEYGNSCYSSPHTVLPHKTL